VHVIGGGLAGSEAAWQIAQAGVPVVLHEMRPVRGTDAHQTDRLAELVCSNSFRADDWTGNAVGLLHAEMRRLGSIILSAVDAHQAPAAGGDEWHLHAHVAPPLRGPGVQRYIASAERGGGTLSNPVLPEAAAQALRDA